MRNLVTGATGFVGSHIVERLADAGEEVIAYARKSSDTRMLDEMGVEVRFGSLTDPCCVSKAMAGIDRVFHVAAVTGEWVRPSVTYEVNVQGTANLLEAALEHDVERFLFISSLAVMGYRNHYNTGVETDYVMTGDAYIDTKMEAEKLVWRFGKFGLPVTVVRPGFMYGPRDRRFMKRILNKLATGSFKFVGDGRNKLNLNYVGNLADAALLAADCPRAAGQAYNIANDDQTLDMETFISKVAKLWGYNMPDEHIPVGVAKVLTGILEPTYRLLRTKEPPLLTKTRLKFLNHNLEFDISKAKEELGFANRIGIDRGLAMTKEWIEQSGAYDEPAKKTKAVSEASLPYLYRDGLTVESDTYRTHVINEIRQLKGRQGAAERIIRLESILGQAHQWSDSFEIGQFEASGDGIMKYNKWKCEHAEHVLIYVNGLESHGGWFSDAACDLARMSIATYALDRRGSGLNCRSIGTWRDWIGDVDRIIKIAREENPQADINLVSICLGALVATSYAIEKPEGVDSLIYISPGFNVRVDPTGFDKLLIGLDVIPGLRFNVPSPIQEDRMFTDSAKALYYLYKDKLRSRCPRASDFRRIAGIRSWVLRNIRKVKVPSLVLLAQRDQVVDTIETKQTLCSLGRQPEVLDYAGAAHALMFGDSRERLVADIAEFVRKLSGTEEAAETASKSERLSLAESS